MRQNAPRLDKDTCAPLRKPFSDLRNHAVTSAVVGAAIGLGAGFLLGKLTGQRGNNLAATALSGAVAGAAFSWVKAKQEQGMQEAELQQALSQEMGPEMSNYSRLAGQLAELGNCRRAQLYEVRTEAVTHAITREEAMVRANRIMTWVSQDDAVVSQAAKVQSDRVGYYAQAYGATEGMTETQVGDGTAVLRTVSDRRGNAYEPRIEVSSSNTSGSEPDDSSAARPVSDGSLTWYARAPRGAAIHDSPGSRDTMGTAPFGSPISVAGVAPQDPAWFKVSWHGQDAYVRGDQMAAQPPAASAGHKKAHPHPHLAPTQTTPARAPAAHNGPILIHVSNVTATPTNATQHLLAGGASSHAVSAVMAKNRVATKQQYDDLISAIPDV
jgi:hypothetical protein